MADKGIGGTGAPLLTDRGIGGTGGPSLADKGIGGTGIIATISGFASICLAGEEVALPAGTPILLGSEPSDAGALRVGQVAVVDAVGGPSALSARRVTVRFEALGPVETATDSELRVAGQPVAVTAATLGERPAVGDWVAVSGIRRADGVIEATRLEPRRPGPIVVHGVLRRDGGQFHVGALMLAPAPGLSELEGRSVTATGSLLFGRLVTETIAPDVLVSDPAAFFGPTVGTVLVEGFGEFGGDRLRLGQGLVVPAARGSLGVGPQRGVFRLERGADGLRATGGPSDGVGRGPPMAGGLGGGQGDRSGGARSGDDRSGRDHRFTPAPVPNRSLFQRGGGAGPGQPGAGFPQQPREGRAHDANGPSPAFNGMEGPLFGGGPGRGR